ncbi:MAG: DUF58 domain-containing protein [Cytophagales bacterium]|nr:DUF58 domain-containing protein [Cytophagales bacterium]
MSQPAVKVWSFDPSMLVSISDFDWLVRALAKGILFGGRHSLRLGAGMEFSQYRPYSQGDDLRRLDWKMYGRTERFYIKQSEIETDIHFNLVIDHSLSMTYAEQDMSKLNQAKLMAALFGYIALRNGDSFSLIMSGHQLPVGHGEKQWQRLLHRLIALQPVADFHPKMLAGHQPGVTLVFSDFFGEGADWARLMQDYKRPRTEVFAFHMLGKVEQSLDFSGSIAFEDLETSQKVKVNAKQQGEEYRKRFSSWLDEFKSGLMQQGIWYETAHLGEHPGELVQRFVKKTRLAF